jgi:hypothetical protein
MFKLNMELLPVERAGYTHSKAIQLKYVILSKNSSMDGDIAC